MAWSNWKQFYKTKKFINEMVYADNNKLISVNYDEISETEKAWIVRLDQKKFVYPKSKTVHYPDKKQLEVPKWLYEKNS